MRYKNIWKQLKLKQKMLAVFLPVNILSTILILIVSMTILIKNGKSEALNTASEKLRLVTDQTDQILSNVKYNIKAFSTSSALQDAIRTKYPDNEYGNYLFSSAMHSSIYNIMDIQHYISNGYIQTYDGRVYDLITNEISSSTIALDKRYHDIVSKKGQIILEPAMVKNGTSALCISKSLIDINTGSCLGILSFDIRESLFRDAYIQVLDPKNEHFIIVDNNNTIISSSNTNDLQKDFTKIEKSLATTQSTHKLVMSTKTKNGNLNIYYYMDYYNVYNKVFKLSFLLLAIGLVVLLVIVILSNLLAKSIVKPITQLALFADESGNGNFDIPIFIQSNDEIGFLQERFLNMNANIKELTTKIYNEQAEKKEFELKLLQSQINPHFLYNCLDNICCLITDNQTNSAISMIYHLGKYYRSILSKGRNIITVQEELNLIQDYLEIQLIKTPNLFKYNIDVTPEIYNLKILKMILQPIAENSVLHGFSNYKTGGLIQIKGWLENQTVYISITDNGIGISKSKLNTFWNNSNISYPKHFGLKNIHERLQLKFGSEFGIQIHSVENIKTTVIITFPKII